MTQPQTANAFIDLLDQRGALEYLELRPTYPADVAQMLRAQVRSKRPQAVDVGAGSGQMTRTLADHGFEVVAVEPSGPMRRVLASQPWVAHTGTRVVDALAETTGLPTASADLVTWAQCFHWLDAPRATAEAARVLRPGGVAAAIFNQLDVAQPWVKRLTRIMRSGDVALRQPPPDFGPHFEKADLFTTEWTHSQSVEQVMALARTRSSYIRSSKSGRERMQENLRWYLFDRLGFRAGETIELPYRTFVWWGRVTV